ncbi:MAG: thioredoxin family protein [Pseudomonadota bacterium]
MSLFDKFARNLITQWNQTLNQTVHIKLILPEQSFENQSDQKTLDQFLAIRAELTELAPHLEIKLEHSEKQWPGFELAQNITFCAWPMEKELGPFLDTISSLSKKEFNLSESIQNSLDQIDIPVTLKLYIALFCPHCPAMVKTLIPLALYCRKIDLQIIDGTLYEQAAKNDKVMSAPCLILDDTFQWTGAVSPQEIVNMIINRDPSQLSMDTLKNIMEQGDAAWIAQQMIHKNMIFDSFVQLLCHPAWSVRLGAMVVVEQLAQDAPDLADSLCPILINEFDSKNISVQGDILYALGEAGNNVTRQWIDNRLGSFSHPDLIDAALDAMETIMANHATG